MTQTTPSKEALFCRAGSQTTRIRTPLRQSSMRMVLRGIRMSPPSLSSTNFKVICRSWPAASIGEEEMESPLGHGVFEIDRVSGWIFRNVLGWGFTWKTVSALNGCWKSTSVKRIKKGSCSNCKWRMFEWNFRKHINTAGSSIAILDHSIHQFDHEDSCCMG